MEIITLVVGLTLVFSGILGGLLLIFSRLNAQHTTSYTKETMQENFHKIFTTTLVKTHEHTGIEITCSKCEEALQPEDLFCNNCGTSTQK